MRLAVLYSVVILGTCLGVAGVSSAQPPRDTLASAEREFRYQNYQEVIVLLTPILEPEPLLPTRDEVERAREMLGASQWWQGRKGPFNHHFSLILQDNPTYELDSFYFPPEMVEEFHALKKQLLELGIIKEGDRKPDAVLRDVLVVERNRVQRSPWPNLVPFGVGQFNNRKTGKGVFFLASQALSLAVNVGTWTYMYSASPTGQTREALVGTMYVSLGVFGALALWGIIDGFAQFVPEEILEEKRIEQMEPWR
jgi:hypothetical protein